LLGVVGVAAAAAARRVAPQPRPRLRERRRFGQVGGEACGIPLASLRRSPLLVGEVGGLHDVVAHPLRIIAVRLARVPAAAFGDISPGKFVLAVILAALLSMWVYWHASRHGSKHATAWGLLTFLAVG